MGEAVLTRLPSKGDVKEELITVLPESALVLYCMLLAGVAGGSEWVREAAPAGLLPKGDGKEELVTVLPESALASHCALLAGVAGVKALKDSEPAVLADMLLADRWQEAGSLEAMLLAKERIRAKIQAELDLVEDEISESLDAAGPVFLVINLVPYLDLSVIIWDQSLRLCRFVTIVTLQQTFTPPNTLSRSRKTDAEAVVFATPLKPAAYVDHSYLQSPSPASGHDMTSTSRLVGAANTQMLNDCSRFRSCSPTPAPRIVPGERFVLPSTPTSVASSISYAASNVPGLNTSAWYILYHGRDGAQGLFDSYDEHRSGKQSLRDLTQFYNHRIFKKFNDYPMAKMYYEELVESKVLDMLQPAPEKDEVYIVI
ncbi:hypothetical protein GG344DRAFT_70765 [Lentinula edodes]|nr:hypothetical protein GG344DRAFT_70765 [Lentinula edodes]